MSGREDSNMVDILPLLVEAPSAAHQALLHGEILCQAHERIVHSAVAVRMVLAQHLSHHARALAMWLIRCEAQVVHGKQDPPVHWLQAVPHIWQRPPHDDGHRILHSHRVTSQDLHESASAHTSPGD